MAMEIVQVIANAHEDSITSIAYNRVKREVFSAAEGDKAIKIWDLRNGQLLRTQTVHRGMVTSLAYASNVKLLFSGSIDGCIGVWTDKGNLLQIVPTGWPVFSIAWGSKQRILVAGGNSILHVYKVDMSDVLRLKHARHSLQPAARQQQQQPDSRAMGLGSNSSGSDAPQVLRRVCPAFKGWKIHQRPGGVVANDAEQLGRREHLTAEDVEANADDHLHDSGSADPSHPQAAGSLQRDSESVEASSVVSGSRHKADAVSKAAPSVVGGANRQREEDYYGVCHTDVVKGIVITEGGKIFTAGLTLAAAPAANSLSLSGRGLSPMTHQGSVSGAAAAVSGAYDEESLGILATSASQQELSNLMGELSSVDLLEATRTDERSTREELRCVLAVVRHGDRTPKQKLKVRVRQPALLQLFMKHADSKGKQAKLKSPAQLQELLDLCRQLLQDLQHTPPPGSSEEDLESREEQKEKLNIVKTVLEQGGQFSGINRKVQLKPLVWSTPAAAAQPAAAAAGVEQEGGDQSGKPQQQQQQTPGSEYSQQQQQQSDKPVIQEVLLILKYGGVLTHAGRAQAEELGKVFRLVMYPRFGSGGGGLLRLHSTYRHDLKIYSSDEGRVQVSAAAFTKGLLALEGSSLTPILVSLVTKDASMLDAFGKGASEDIRQSKEVLYTTMTWDPTTATANNYTPNWNNSSRANTPAPTSLLTSPPLSPRAVSRSGSSGGGSSSIVAAAAAPAAAAGIAGGSSNREDQDDLAAAAAHGNSAATAGANGSAAAAAAGSSNPLVVNNIPGMPDNPLAHLKKLNELMKTMVEQLRQLVLAEKRQGVNTAASSSARDLVQTEAAAAAAVTPPAAGSSSSSSSSNGQQQQQQQLPKTMTSLTASSKLVKDSPTLDKPDRGLRKPPKGLVNSPPRPATAPPGGAAASSSSSSSVVSSRYSSLSHDQADWTLLAGQPCSGEKLLLMFDRWQKLAKSFCKKGRFDISKVPDIYDSAKYDALHNMHLGLGPTLDELYKEAKILADAVIPNEYGIDADGKLAIGSKIATELLAKLLDDLRNSKEESLATLTDAERSGLGQKASIGGGSSQANPGSSSSSRFDKPLGRKSMPAGRTLSGSRVGGAAAAAGGGKSSSNKDLPALERSAAAAAAAAKEVGQAAGDKNNTEITDPGSDHGVGGEAEVENFIEDDYFFDEEPEMMHRLCPNYASDINSPLRHVRTRIYFTSESHMHSLVNILRFCHLRYQLLGSSSSGNLPDSGSTPRSSMDTASAAAAAAADPAAAAAATLRSSSSGSTASPASPAKSHIGAAAAAAAHGDSSSSSPPGPLISDDAIDLLRSTTELDYLTQLVFRLYENKAVAADHPQRFRIEILFSAGTAYDPITEPPAQGNHTLPPKPRVDLHIGEGATLADFDKLLRPFAAKRRQQQQQQQQQQSSVKEQQSVKDKDTKFDRAICAYDIDKLDKPKEAFKKVKDCARAGLTSLTFDAHNNVLLAGSLEGAMRIWSVEGRCLDKFEGLSIKPISVIHLPHVNQWWANGRSGRVAVLDPRAPTVITEYVAAPNQLLDHAVELLVAPAGSELVLAGTTQRQLVIWQFNPHAAHRVFSAHDDWVEGLLVCNQDSEADVDQAFFSFSADGHVRSWTLDTEQNCDIYRLVEETQVADCNVLCMLHLPEQHCIAAGCEDGVIRMHYAEGYEPTPGTDGGPVPLSLEGHEGKVTGLIALPGNLMLSCSEDRSFRVWNLTTLKQVHAEMSAHDTPIISMDYCAAHCEVATCCLGSKVKVWSIPKPTQPRLKLVLDHSETSNRPKSAGLKAPGDVNANGQNNMQWLTRSDIDGLEGVPKTKNNTLPAIVAEAIAHASEDVPEVTQVRWVGYRDCWVTTADDEMIRLWSTDGKKISEFAFKGGSCKYLYVDEGNQLVLASTADKCAYLFNLDSPMPLARFAGHGDIISGIGYISALDCYITSSWDTTLRLWKRPQAPAPADAAATTTVGGSITVPAPGVQAAGAASGVGGSDAAYLLPDDSEEEGDFVSEYEKAHPLIAPKGLNQDHTLALLQAIGVSDNPATSNAKAGRRAGRLGGRGGRDAAGSDDDSMFNDSPDMPGTLGAKLQELGKRLLQDINETASKVVADKGASSWFNPGSHGLTALPRNMSTKSALQGNSSSQADAGRKGGRPGQQ